MTDSKSLSLAVVGHTNTGKTSLLRTLLRDGGFGEVADASATTRHVERAAVCDDGGTLLYLYDTPGLEDAGGVLDWLEANTSPREDGVDRLHAFLASPAAAGEFGQEAKVLRQLLQSDSALYVIDAREPVLNKYKDELTVLSWCAKPLMPVFNFTSGGGLSAWTDMLARRGLHVCSSFDTVAFDFDGEIRLWQNLATMLPDDGMLRRLISWRQDEWRLEEMQAAVRQAERRLQSHLLGLYRFYYSEIDNDGGWALSAFSQDPFDGDLLKEYGIRTGTGAAAGALIGMGIDLATLGGSLGLGAALGGLIGGVLPNMGDLSDKISGRQTLHIDSATLTLLAARALDLLHALQTRGHAAQSPVVLQSGKTPWPADKLPSELNRARRHPDWSPLNGGSEMSAERRECARTLAERLKNAKTA